MKTLYVGAALIFGLALNLPAEAKNYVEGQDYVKVGGISETKTPVLREFFSYNCPHCYHKDPQIAATVALLSKDIDFVRTPIGAGRPAWILSQQAYYVSQKLKLTEQVHAKIFNQIHELGKAFTRPEQLKAFFVAQGVSPEVFDATFNSVDNKFTLSNYDFQAQLAEIKAVPSLLVNGHYLLNPSSFSPSELAELVRYVAALAD
ncbi:thiol:disulfide interchange protein DsbA/DsbL [Shewanella sp. AS16]|uniref:thiol:disulfide interchange protein DsbA/DsbL n=1 Tax=Shewanella sp. AS16 TaxID=2907625 RepID=UPI001F3054CA|nr:thiol:disulfide interchange protein DsbA/DsbL [Shewanella sp. AS16]MCE9686911.1 thiol:disulfide interchange protein DsbA/DsbL [Shewanella sp. AS16]